ncbi:MAG TPA: hypothetical protein PKL13_04760 [bacterium]|nr:hypothetical protein [bacterium]
MINKEFDIINNLIYKNKLQFIRDAKKYLNGEHVNQGIIDVSNVASIDKEKCLNLLDKFDNISLLEIRELVKSFIFIGEAAFVLQNIDKFRGVEPDDVFYFLIKNKDYRSIVIYTYGLYPHPYRSAPKIFEDNDLILSSIRINYENSYLEDLYNNLYLSRSTVLEISEKGNFDNLSDFISKSQVLSETEEKKYESDIKMFDALLDNDFSFKFNKLQYYSKKQAAIRLINNDYGAIVENGFLNSEFKNCDADDILDILLYLINFNKSDLVIRILKYSDRLFPKLRGVDFYNRIAIELIKIRKGGLVLNNINIFKGLKENFVIVQMLKYGYRINTYPANFSYQTNLNNLEKILKQNKLGDLDRYLSKDGNLEDKFIANLSEKVSLLFKYYNDSSLCSFEEEGILWEAAFAREHKIQGAVFSLFLLSSILIDLNEIIDYGKMGMVSELCNLSIPCLPRVDWVTCGISTPESGLDFTKEFIKKLADSNNFEFILNNIDTFNGYLDDIINFIAYSHSNLISFDNIEKLEKINIKKIDIKNEIATKLFFYNRLNELAYYLPELGYNCEDMLTESVKKDMQDLREEGKVDDVLDSGDYLHLYSHDEYEDGVEVNQDEEIQEVIRGDEYEDDVAMPELENDYYYLG